MKIINTNDKMKKINIFSYLMVLLFVLYILFAKVYLALEVNTFDKIAFFLIAVFFIATNSKAYKYLNNNRKKV